MENYEAMPVRRQRRSPRNLQPLQDLSNVMRRSQLLPFNPGSSYEGDISESSDDEPQEILVEVEVHAVPIELRAPEHVSQNNETQDIRSTTGQIRSTDTAILCSEEEQASGPGTFEPRAQYQISGISVSNANQRDRGNNDLQNPSILIRECMNGLQRGLQPDKILGAAVTMGEIKVLMRWSTGEVELIWSRDVKEKFPQLLIEFYEKYVVWNE